MYILTGSRMKWLADGGIHGFEIAVLSRAAVSGGASYKNLSGLHSKRSNRQL